MEGIMGLKIWKNRFCIFFQTLYVWSIDLFKFCKLLWNNIFKSPLYFLLTLSIKIQYLNFCTKNFILAIQNHTYGKRIFFFWQIKHHHLLHSPSADVTLAWKCYHCGKKYSFGYWYSAPPHARFSHVGGYVCVRRYACDSSWFAWQHFTLKGGIFTCQFLWWKDSLCALTCLIYAHIHICMYVCMSLLSDSRKYLQSKRKVNKYDQIMAFCTFQNHWLAWIILTLIIMTTPSTSLFSSARW